MANNQIEIQLRLSFAGFLRASAWETGADLEMKVGRFRLKLVHKVLMWTYVICQSFSFNDFFLAEFWISAPQGSPVADFSVQFWPLLNLFFSNMKLISGKNKTIFVKPYPWAFMGENISSWKFFASLWLLSQLGHIWSIWEATGNGLFFRPNIFHAHVLYLEVLVSLQSSALSLVISRKKY